MPDLTWLTTDLEAWRSAGLGRARRVVRHLPDAWCEIDGRRVRDFAGNDYLALAHDPRVVAAARQALELEGSGATASALVTGRGPAHASLETALAEFFQAEAALLFPTGFAANLGVLGALSGPEDVLFCDRWNHASLVDGCRLSGAPLRVYRHEALDDLRRHLARAKAARRRFLVTDGLFSMDGDIAPLGELCDIADEHDAVLIVDEAHGLGVCGPHGRGTAELFGVGERVPVRIGTLSKACASLGGFVVGAQALIDWLWNHARPQVFSTALPPSACAAGEAALGVIRTEPERRARLERTSGYLRLKLRDAGLPAHAGAGPIVPLLTGSPERTTALAAGLLAAGFLVGAIRPPSVPHGTSRLRLTVTSAHTPDDVDQLVAALLALLPTASGAT